MSDQRHFDNPFDDFDGTETVLDNEGRLKKSIEKDLMENLNRLLSKLEKGLHRDTNWEDASVYTGTSGYALLYLHLADKYQDGELVRKARHFAEKQLSGLRHKRFSFLCGDPGPLAVAAVIYHRLGMEAESQKQIENLVRLQKFVVPLENDIPDEILYGRAGYLFSLLFIQKNISKSVIDEELVRKVVSSIVKSGEELSRLEKRRSPLMYIWHEKHYLGAAHGLAGILYMLLQAREQLTSSELQTLVRPSIDYYMSIKYPSGNLPSSLGSRDDRLIHWCHGAPGAIHLFALAYQVFNDDQYLKAARSCAEVIWERGILRKGYGICHGTAGNGYAFLRMYQLTGEERYLYRAVKFAEWCYDYGQHGCRIADRPLSLYEGLAGTIYFLTDLLNPKHSAFPAFQLF